MRNHEQILSLYNQKMEKEGIISTQEDKSFNLYGDSIHNVQEEKSEITNLT
jgi:hypothetical protein